MATKRIQLAVNTPCQQQWQEMTPTGTGRFCDQCQKTVVDFSGLTDRQIADIVRQSTSATCGRFRASQLNRTLQAPTPALYSPRRFFTLLTAGLLGYQTVQADALAMPNRPSTSQTDQRSAGTSDQPATEVTTATDSSRVITGRIVDNVTNTTLGGVFIIIKGTARGANTDLTGHFQLTIPTEINDDLITLTVGFIGFQTQEIQLRPGQSDPLLISLKEDQGLLGEVIVVGGYKVEKKVSVWKRLQNRRRKGH